MERRELLKQIAILTGSVFVGGELFLTGCQSGPKIEANFSPGSVALLDEVAETIIPTTKTPGAKAAQVGAFMKVFVTDCYTEPQQKVFTNGILQLEEACKKMHSKSFMECDEKQRKDFLLTLEKEAKPYNEKVNKDNEGKKEEEKAPVHYYTMMKQLTLFGFFTSKTGATETLRYIQVPGKYDGAFPYKKGDRAWADA